jgi:hypothetical protein
MVDQVGVTHHVKIGSEHYLIRPGSYKKAGAPKFGAQFATGDPDFNSLSFWQHWVQRDWIGGFGAPEWRDEAMFDEGVGIDAQYPGALLLARDLGPNGATRATLNYDLRALVAQREFTIFNGKLYCVEKFAAPTKSVLFRYDDGTDTWVSVHTFNDEVRCMEPYGGRLVFGDGSTDLAYMLANETFGTIAKPASVGTTAPYTMKTWRGQLYVTFNNSIWRLKSNLTWDGSTAFFTAEGATYLSHSELHLGFLYFTSSNGHIIRTDGNNTFDLWQFEAGQVPAGVRSYDGKLFVSINEPLVGTTAQQSILYQFSGAAVTELKRWGQVGRDLTTGRMRVIGSRLYFGAASMLGIGTGTGFGIGMYDATQDAYYVFASNQDGTTYAGGTEGVNWIVDDLIWYRGYVWCSVRGHGIFKSLVSHRDVEKGLRQYDTTAAGGAVGSLNGGWYTSSDFDAGTPGLLKYWDAVVVDVDIAHGAASVTVDVSADGGVGWKTIGSVVGGDTIGQVWNRRYRRRFPIVVDYPGGGSGPLRSARLKVRLTLRTTNTTHSPLVRGVTVRYVPIPEPTWRWDMTLVLSERQELLDGTVVDVDVDAKLAALEAAFRTGVTVDFEDADGADWLVSAGDGVLINDLEQSVRVIGPSTDGDLEREVRVVLLEGRESTLGGVG